MDIKLQQVKALADLADAEGMWAASIVKYKEYTKKLNKLFKKAYRLSAEQWTRLAPAADSYNAEELHRMKISYGVIPAPAPKYVPEKWKIIAAWMLSQLFTVDETLKVVQGIHSDKAPKKKKLKKFLDGKPTKTTVSEITEEKIYKILEM